MKNINLLLIISIIFCSCLNKNKRKEEIKASNNFQIKFQNNYFFKKEYFKNFINDFTELPECKNRKFFAIYIDQRSDTIVCTLIRYPIFEKFKFYCLGYFEVNDKIIFFNSTLSTLIDIKLDSIKFKELANIYEKEKVKYEKQKNKKIIWQLQVNIFDGNYKIVKDTLKIHNTLAGPVIITKEEVNIKQNQSNSFKNKIRK
jgi:hypothetical protein